MDVHVTNSLSACLLQVLFPTVNKFYSPIIIVLKLNLALKFYVKIVTLVHALCT